MLPPTPRRCRCLSQRWPWRQRRPPLLLGLGGIALTMAVMAAYQMRFVLVLFGLWMKRTTIAYGD